MSAYLTENNLYQVSQNGDNVSVTGKTAVRTGNNTVSWSGYKDISALTGGIFASGSTREIFAALQWNEHVGSSVVNLDLFSVAQGGSEMKWEKVHRVATNHTASSGVTVAKMAVGDFNGDGYANEIAVVTNVPDQWKYYLYVYQVNWKNNAIEVTTLAATKEIYSHERYNVENNSRRDIWFLKPVCDIAMADFNGDGKKEIAVIYKGYNEDWPSGFFYYMRNTMGPVYVKLYQYSTTKTGNLIESKTVSQKSFSYVGKSQGFFDSYTPVSNIGDLKATAADVDGDGKSELVMLGMFWNTKTDGSQFSTVVMGEWKSQLHIWRHDTPQAGTEITDVPATLNMKYDKQIADFGTFYKSEEEVAQTDLSSNNGNGNIGGERYLVKGNTFTEPMFQIISGVFSGVISSSDKPCEDIIISHASHMGQSSSYIKAFCPVLDNNGKFKEFKTVDITTGTKSDNITIGLAAGDFVGDGVLLKNPYHFYYDGRSVFTSVIQALPYHIDYIPLPWEKERKA